jgi:glycerol kinase
MPPLSGVDSTQGLYFVSAFGGLLAPHWRDDARGTLVGLTLAHDKRHVSRAVLEGIAFQAADVVGAMLADTGAPLAPPLRVDGGVALSDPLLQYQADLLDIPVARPANVETTAAGAAIAAGLGSGVFGSVDEAAAAGGEIERTFAPSISAEERAARMGSWKRAVEASLGWAGAA